MNYHHLILSLLVLWLHWVCHGYFSSTRSPRSCSSKYHSFPSLLLPAKTKLVSAVASGITSQQTSSKVKGKRKAIEPEIEYIEEGQGIAIGENDERQSNLNGKQQREEEFDDDEVQSSSAGVEFLDRHEMRPKKEINDKEWMFFDVARINVKGGDGGNGCKAMRREYKIEFGGPSGGNGGHGGNIYLECDKTLNTLAPLRGQVHYKAEKGNNGLGDSRHGQRGSHLVIKVPPGTIVRDQTGALAGELNNHGDRMMVAKGGRGGRGNEYFKTPKMTAPAFAEKGEKGCERWLNVELKLLADIGLVGVPNAGKSTLLAAVSNAKPKIADYPFTTVVPNLGVCDVFAEQQKNGEMSSGSIVIADIPGLLEGAHEGVGLGLAFLRHIQRCRVIIHVIKGDSEDPIGDFKAINQELELYNPKMLNKTQVIVINKIDIPEVREKLHSLISELQSVAGHNRILAVSAATREKTKELMFRVNNLLRSLPRQTSLELFLEEEEGSAGRVNFEEEDSEDQTNSEFEVMTDPAYPGQFRVVGKKIEKIVEMTNWEYYEALQRFQRILDAEGISSALELAGAKQGDLVMIGDWDFNYWNPKNRWIADLGLEEVNPRRRPTPFNEEVIDEFE